MAQEERTDDTGGLSRAAPVVESQTEEEEITAQAIHTDSIDVVTLESECRHLRGHKITRSACFTYESSTKESKQTSRVFLVSA